MLISLFAFARYFIAICLLIFSPISVYADLASETIYLTWQQRPDTTMTVQWISLAAEKDSAIYVKSQGEEWRTAQGVSLNLSQDCDYLLHRVELTGLKQNALYQFKVADQETIFQFRTMPEELVSPIRFVVGGDMYHDELSLMKETSRQAAKCNPSFALIGGDIAYAVAGAHSPQKIQRWIEWTRAWHETMVSPDRCLIPVVCAIGNHDLLGQFDQTPAQAKIFSALFPMPGEQIYNVLDFGCYLSLILLDSGHAHPISGAQTEWLGKTLVNRRHISHRFAVYHVPAYPSIRPSCNALSRSIRQHWVPLFEKEGVEFAFEHHDHAYKRTYPLIQDEINANGVVYVGDGAWGIERPRYPQSVRKRPYLAKFASARHFLLITLDPEKTRLVSLDSQGQVIDDYTRGLPAKLKESTPSNSN